MLLNSFRYALLPALLLLVGLPTRATALEKLCDPAHENCRTPLINLIRAETKGIDVAFWFMEDYRYVNEIVARWKAGVPVRIIMDTEATPGYPLRAQTIAGFKAAGIPMREKTSSGIMHWKMMLFAGQNTVQFSGANYSDEAFVPYQPYVNYVDEVIYFTDQPSLVASFKTMYDNVWTSTSGYTNYANVTSLSRVYPTSPIDPVLNFVPYQNFRSRSVALYKTEPTRIDAIMYRITDRAHSDQMIAAVARGVPVRLITEPYQYRDVTRLWHSWNVDRMYVAGIQIRHRYHQGISHEKLTLLVGQQLSIFGSSNWTSASADYQLEHNIFTKDPAFFSWSRAHFDRKWNNTGPAQETQPFVPQPPNTPLPKLPANGATGQPTTVTLTWYAGPWAHKYDVFLGTSSSNMTKVLNDVELGPSEHSQDYVTYTASGLVTGTTYYWKVVSRTMANLSVTGPTWNFTVGGTAPPPPPPPPSNLPTGWAARDIGSASPAGSSSYSSGTFTVKGGGPDIWGTADELQFAYKTLSGDGSITARVASLSSSNAWGKAGVMIRESLATGAKEVSLVTSVGNGLAFLRRTATDSSTAYTSGGSGAAPIWLRLTRTGSTINAYRSPDGSTWTLVGTQSVSMASTVYVGLAVTMGNTNSLATATFTNVN